MASLDLTTDRGFHEIEVSDYDGTVLKLKIPKELKVSEVERILDLQIKAEEVAKQELSKLDEGVAQTRLFWEQIFSQLLIMFNVYQPELTQVKLRTLFSQQEALTIAGFFENKRFLKIGEDNAQKKTLKSPTF